MPTTRALLTRKPYEPANKSSHQPPMGSRPERLRKERPARRKKGPHLKSSPTTVQMTAIKRTTIEQKPSERVRQTRTALLVLVSLASLALFTDCRHREARTGTDSVQCVEGAPVQLAAADIPTFAFSLFAPQQTLQLEPQAEHDLIVSGQSQSSQLYPTRLTTGDGSGSGDDETGDEADELEAADDAAAYAAAAGVSLPTNEDAGGQFGEDHRVSSMDSPQPVQRRGTELIDANDSPDQDPSSVLVKKDETAMTGSSTKAELSTRRNKTAQPVDSVDDDDDDDDNDSFDSPVAGIQRWTQDFRSWRTMGTDNKTTAGANSARVRGHLVHLPNGLSVQFCDEQKMELSCDDGNAICKLGACVCKPGYILNRQSSLCQSISDLLKNCQDDLQCQAINVDLVCDTKSYDRPTCDCVGGLYFDQDTHTCLPCYRNSFLLSGTTSTGEILASGHTSAPPISMSNKTLVVDTQLTASNLSSATNSTGTGRGGNSSIVSAGSEHLNSSSPLNTTSAINVTELTPTAPVSPVPDGQLRGNQLRPCRPINVTKLGRRKQKLYGMTPFAHQYDDLGERLQMLANGGLRPTAAGSGSASFVSSPTQSTSSSDPFRIKTPLEVFMGAIMLFTLFTVAWLFLQRIIHDCRTIMKSIHSGHPADMLPGGACDPNFTSTFTTTTTTTIPAVDPLEVLPNHQSNSSLAASRLAAVLSGGGSAGAGGTNDFNLETTPGFFTRRANANQIGYVATALGAYHRSLGPSFMAAPNIGTGGAPTTAANPTSGSNPATPLATAVTNGSGDNSSSARSAITRLLGDDTADEELVASMVYPFVHGPGSPHQPASGYSTTNSQQQQQRAELTAQEATARLIIDSGRLAVGARPGDHHPGLAILRVAMAQSRFNYAPPAHQFPPGCMPVNYFDSTFEPPPKYEEAIAQGGGGGQQLNYFAPATLRSSIPASISSRVPTPTNFSNTIMEEDDMRQQGPQQQEHDQNQPTADDTGTRGSALSLSPSSAAINSTSTQQQQQQQQQQVATVSDDNSDHATGTAS